MIMVIPDTISLVSSNVPVGDNRDYMFDAFISTQTEYANLIEVEIDASNCDRVALFNLDATSVDFELTDNNASAVVQSETVDLETVDGDYQSWIVQEIYIYADATLKISINKSGADAKCGVCAIGRSTYIGSTLYGLKAGFLDFSRKEIDGFGQAYLAVGRWAKNPEFRTFVEADSADAVAADLAVARATLCIFEGNEGDTDFETLRIYGFIQDWRIQYVAPGIAWLDISIQGAV